MCISDSVTLRRPLAGARPTLRRLEEHTGSVRQPLGAHRAAALAAHDWLAARDDAALAGERLAVAPDVTEERFHTPGAPDPTVVLLRQGDGLGRAVRATTGLAALVGASDGELTVGQLVGALAALVEVGAADRAGELRPGGSIVATTSGNPRVGLSLGAQRRGYAGGVGGVAGGRRRARASTPRAAGGSRARVGRPRAPGGPSGPPRRRS